MLPPLKYKSLQQNKARFLMDMVHPVFSISAGLVILFSILTLAFPERADQYLHAAKDWSLVNFGWFYGLMPVLIFGLCVTVAVSPLGRTRLGGTQAQVEYSWSAWIAMLFAAGVGIGFMFYGVTEPLGYYMDWAGTPLGVQPQSLRAHNLAISASIFHWGIFPWSIYVIVGLSLAYFCYNRGLPLAIRSAFVPLMGRHIWGWPGHVIDILAVVASIFGLACSIGLGAIQVSGGLNYVFEVPINLKIQIIIIFVITAFGMVSVFRGMQKGIKLLSTINMLIAAGFVVFIGVMGPTWHILQAIWTALVQSIPDNLRLANWIGREDRQFFYDWTLFYWAWWISWAPLIGLFIARISKGRTIRQFIFTILLAPFVMALIWFSVLGEAAIYFSDKGQGGILSGVDEVGLVLFQLLDILPFSLIVSVIAILLMIVFLTTSIDSGAVVIDSLATAGQLETQTRRRFFWLFLISLTAVALLYGGGEVALKSLQAGTITMALPFGFVLLVYCFSFVIELTGEYRRNSAQGKQTP